MSNLVLVCDVCLLDDTVFFLAHRYSHVERSVFLLEPAENGWGVVNAKDVSMPPGQKYLALLTDRPINYLANRLFNPVSSTVSLLNAVPFSATQSPTFWAMVGLWATCSSTAVTVCPPAWSAQMNDEASCEAISCTTT